MKIHKRWNDYRLNKAVYKLDNIHLGQKNYKFEKFFIKTPLKLFYILQHHHKITKVFEELEESFFKNSPIVYLVSCFIIYYFKNCYGQRLFVIYSVDALRRLHD